MNTEPLHPGFVDFHLKGWPRQVFNHRFITTVGDCDVYLYDSPRETNTVMLVWKPRENWNHDYKLQGWVGFWGTDSLRDDRIALFLPPTEAVEYTRGLIALVQ